MGTASQVVTITDDDAPPGISVLDASIVEGQSGTTGLVLGVTLSAPSGKPIAVEYGVANGTAEPRPSRAWSSGRQASSAGPTVAVVGDLVRELDEGFTVVLSAPSYATLTRAVATATIVDNDRPPIGSKSDFNWDDQPDVLWRHDSTGQVLVWLMQDTTLTSEIAPTPAYGTAGHVVVGTADFYNDGAADIVWQHTATGDVSIWIRSGLTRQGTAAVPNLGDPAWRVKVVADINMDAHPDLVWQHQTQGWLVVSMLVGSTTVAQHALSPWALPTGWQVVGSGDLDQDGFTDLVLQHDTNGDLSWFKLDGYAQVSGASLSPASMPNTQWKIRGTLDLDADGQTDLLWQNVVTGELAVWFMNGTAVRSSTVPTPGMVTDLLWRIVGPR